MAIRKVEKLELEEKKDLYTSDKKKRKRIMNKNQKIAATRKATRAKREQQHCRTYELKVDKSKLSKRMASMLKLLFLQAKWFCNMIIGCADVFAFDSSITQVEVKKGETTEKRELDLLSSQMKQGLLDRIKQDIIDLAKKKKKGQKVGKLKFKKSIRSIPLKQYNNTYAIDFSTNKIHIQNITGWIKVRGLKQLPKDAEFASAVLLWKQGDFYLHITIYTAKQEKHVPEKSIGLDLGIKHQLTLSAGIVVDYAIKMPKNLRRLYQILARKAKGSKNSLKVRTKIQKRFAIWTNRKHDVSHKITHVIISRYKYVCYQKDPVRNWQRIWGTRILDTNIGGLLTELEKKSVTPCPVGQWVATTKRCHKCHYILEAPVPLSERVFRCPKCSYIADRDGNASASIEDLGLELNQHQYYYLLSQSGAERITIPVETSAATRNKVLNDDLVATLNRIPFVRARALNEAGSLNSKSCTSQSHKEAQGFSLG